jgi:ribonuclease E
MKRILINATQAEELRVAMVNGQLLYDLDIEVPSREQKKSNIYKGKITRIEPSLEAAFVNYGADRHGFLPFKEISKIYFKEGADSESGKLSIKDAIKVDQEIVVQIEKEERGNKGAALTSFISLAGRFLVAMPQNPRAGGVSRRIEGEDRDSVKKVLSEIDMPDGMGVIVRTAGVGRSTEEMQWDLDYLNQVWIAIEKAAAEKAAPFLIYQESDIVIRALRDHYKSDIGEILIDSQQAYDQAHDFMSMVMPNTLSKLKKFDDKLPLFNRYQIETQIESAFSREVTLPSGGAIVIDHTEALTSIDINSARATKGSDIEDTAKRTNLEAAEEVARQLRIRDLGGLIVIDFIDMMQNKNQREVESRLRNAVYDDRARVQIGRISRFGLLEMSRQRLRPSLGESSQIVCPRCSGQGTIRDIESLSLAVLRLLEEESLKDSTGKILARIPVECATYLLNEKRDKIDGIEQRRKVHIVIIPDVNLETPHFEIERVKDNDTHRHESNYKKSYELTTEEEGIDLVDITSSQAVQGETAAVQHIEPPAKKPPAAAPVKPTVSQPGLFRKILNALFGNSESEQPKTTAKSDSANRSNRNSNRNQRNRNRGNQNRNRNNAANKNSNDNKQSDSTAGNEQQTANKQEGTDSKRSNTSRSQRSRGGRSGNRQNRSGNRRPRESQAEKSDQSAQPETEAVESKQASEPGRNKSPRSDKADNKPTPTETNAANPNQAENKPVESKSSESRPVEAKSTGTKPEPAAAQVAETRVVEAKGVEAKSVDAKAAESKAAESKPAESKPAESKPADPKPVNTMVDAPEKKAEAPTPVTDKPKQDNSSQKQTAPARQVESSTTTADTLKSGTED